jgi:hypothetical protein
MAVFPRTDVGGISVPRLVCGSNWMLGYSHQTKAKDRFITDLFDTPSKMADVVEVFARAGCNAFMSPSTEFVAAALREVEQRTGAEMIWFATPFYADPADPGSWKQSVELTKRLGAQFCFPHTSITDPLLDKANRRLQPRLVEHLQVVREFGMIPGLSTHAPEAIICSDQSDADVASYIQPYNAAGFLCQIETDWLQRIFSTAKKPVLTIKPLAAGRLHPVTGLEFVWRTIRERDLVTIGTMSGYEAEESIEISLACLEGRQPNVDLQFTRSKRTVLAHQPPA